MTLNIVRRADVDDSHLDSSLPPLLRQIYARRGMQQQDSTLDLKHLLRPETMLGITAGAKLLADAIANDIAILIVGDFDADGATSTCVCLLALRAMGATKVDYLIPNRFDYGYGLSPEIVALAHKQNAQLLLTVDNGISSIAGVKAAKELGMTVIVTDHHLPGQDLPNADVIINPNQTHCTFASKSIAGVGVAFYLMSGLRSELRQRNWFNQHQIPEPKLADLLDIVALGTVADVVNLDANNRRLVAAGLNRIRNGRCRPGISALFEIARRNPTNIVAADIGFAVGPRLNAAGRLDEMSLGVETLLCDDINQAKKMAYQLDQLNDERRKLESSMQLEAMDKLANLQLQDAALPWGLALFQEDWHQGVIGILASRIKEKFCRPVIAFADAEHGLIKGSARSIKGLHIRDTLELINTKYPNLILKFGGHAMAAGLTINAKDYHKFADIFDQTVRQKISANHLENELLSDGNLTSEHFTLATANMLRAAGPWGQGFDEPIFDGYFNLVQQRLVGDKHLKMLLETEDASCLLDGIAFNIDTNIWPDPSIKQVRLAYKLDVNEYKGKQRLQLLVAGIIPN